MHDGAELGDAAAHGVRGEDEAEERHEGDEGAEGAALQVRGVSAEDLGDFDEGDLAGEVAGEGAELDQSHEEGPSADTTDGETKARAVEHFFFFLKKVRETSKE